MQIVRDSNPGAYAVSVQCRTCGKMRRLADMLIDRDGPAFLAYYCTKADNADCLPLVSEEKRRNG